MKKGFLVAIASLLISIGAWSQAETFTIQGEAGGLYLWHTVDAKENWYSVGRTFNLSPKEIAPFNNLSINQPLSIGQRIKIPLTVLNFSQNGFKTGEETLIPVYHQVQEREWLYHISTVYNKVPIENLEKWNHIKRDEAKEGMNLIVGFLRVKTGVSGLTAPPAQTASFSNGQDQGNTEQAAPNPPAAKSSPDKKPAVVTKPDNPAPVYISAAGPAPKHTLSGNYAAGGYFSADYAGGDGHATTGQAGTFRSTSGWNDGKFYGLMNGVAVGTIVKVKSNLTNKIAYVKILGSLPDMKESGGLTIRISNAAAEELATGEGHFPVDVNY